MIILPSKKFVNVATHTVTSGTLHIATKDGEAMFFHDSTDFSAYAGGNYLFRLTSAGKTAQAYVGTVGGGEALGDELITNPELAVDTTDWANSTGDSISRVDSSSDPGTDSVTAGANDKWCVKLVNGGGVECQAYYDKSIYEIGRLYRASMLSYSPSSNLRVGYDRMRIDYVAGSCYSAKSGIDDTWNTHSLNVTATSARLIMSLRGESNLQVGDTFYGDKFSLRSLTDVPATGLHLVSALGGATRNMTSVESGFNVNTITTVQIYRVR